MQSSTNLNEKEALDLLKSIHQDEIVQAFEKADSTAKNELLEQVFYDSLFAEYSNPNYFLAQQTQCCLSWRS